MDRNRRLNPRTGPIAFLTLFGAVASLAQTPQPDPATDEALNHPKVEDTIIEQQRARGSKAPIKPSAKPASTPTPTLSAPDVDPQNLPRELWVAPAQWAGRVLPEGAFLASRQGFLVRTKSGEAVFVPAPAPEASKDQREAPLILLPNQRLAQIDVALGTGADPHRLIASGQVFSYRGRSYLLATAFSLPSVPDAGTRDSKPAPRADAPAPTATSDDRLREMIADLEEKRGTPRALDPANLNLPATRKGDKALEQTLAEGTLITRRRARLVRGAVAAVLAFDNDPNSPSFPPMPILPCRILEHLESTAAQHGEDLSFIVSGRVTTYQSRNFFLPTMYQAVRASDLTSAQ